MQQYVGGEVRFLDVAGSEVFRSGELRMSDSGGLRLGLPKHTLPEGDYVIQLRTAGGENDRVIEEYRRRIAYPQGP